MTANLGSISSGTMRTEDLIPAFAAELDWCTSGGRADRTTEESKLLADADGVEDYDSENASEILSELFDALNEHAPAYAYFGAHEGDGADYGFWIHSDVFESHGCFDGLRVSDTSEVPADYVGEVLHVNDHGNATLYVKDKAESDELREIWAVV